MTALDRFKEIFFTGMSHVVGSLKRVGMKSVFNCQPVQNLIDAGAIVLLVSATPEYCFSIETNTLTQGRCLNPYDYRRSCGGSSGGEVKSISISK